MAGGQQGEGHPAAMKDRRLAENGPVGKAQEQRLVAFPALPNGAEGMQDVPCPQVAGGGRPHIAGIQNAKLAALLEQ